MIITCTCKRLCCDTEYERIKRMTAIDFISSMGGLFGLCLGFSLISFFEILYWFIIRLARNMLG